MTSFKSIMHNWEKQIKKLADSSGLERSLVENVIQYASQMPKSKGGEVDLLIFMAQMSRHFDINSTTIIQSMFESLKKNKTQHISVEEYAGCICTFLGNDTDAKVDYVFNVYDLNHDGSISYHELYSLLRPCIISTESAEDNDNENEESLRELCEMVLRASDVDLNGQIDIDEFKKLVKTDILYLELLGPCLPPEHKVETFKNKLMGKTPFQVGVYFSDERQQSLGELKNTRKHEDQLYPIRLELP